MQPESYKIQATDPRTNATTPPATFAEDAAPVNCGRMLVDDALRVGVRDSMVLPDGALCVGARDSIELAADALCVGVREGIADGAALLEPDGLRPLQSPLLQVLNAHCASLEQAALKLPQAAMSPALLAKHWTPAAH